MSTQVYPTPATGSGGGGGGGTPASTVVSSTSFGQSSAVGTSTDYARADHVHGTPALTAASSVVAETSFGAASAVGTSANYARADHTHGTPTLPTLAPTTASYVLMSADATLTNERTLAVTTTELSRTDGGAGGNVTLGLASLSPSPAGTYTTANITVDAKGRVTAAATGTIPSPSHPSLTTLGWSASGHTGTSNSVAGFTGAGAAQTIQATADGSVLTYKDGVLQFMALAATAALLTNQDKTLDVEYLARNTSIIDFSASAAVGPGSII